MSLEKKQSRSRTTKRPAELMLLDDENTLVSFMASSQTGDGYAIGPYDWGTVSFVNEDKDSPIAAMNVNLRASHNGPPEIDIHITARDREELEQAMQRAGLVTLDEKDYDLGEVDEFIRDEEFGGPMPELRQFGNAVHRAEIQKYGDPHHMECVDGQWIEKPRLVETTSSGIFDHSKILGKKLEEGIKPQHGTILFSTRNYRNSNGRMVLPHEEQMARMNQRIGMLLVQLSFNHPQFLPFTQALEHGAPKQALIDGLGISKAAIPETKMLAAPKDNKRE